MLLRTFPFHGSRVFFSLAILLATLLSMSRMWMSATAIAADWSSWRGPSYNSVSTATGVPTVWSEEKNILWKTELPSWGNSTPVIVGDSIFLTVQTEDDRYSLLRLSKTDGKVVWQQEVGQDTVPRNDTKRGMRGWQKFHNLHNLATPSVAVNDTTAVAVFGNGDIAAFDWNGNSLWKRNLQKDFGDFKIWWGYGASPLLYQDTVIFQVMHDTCADIEEKPSDSYLVAMDVKTGETKWRTIRNTGAKNEACDSYTTPVLWQHEGRTEMLVLGGETLDAYDPATGERIWWLNEGLECIRIVPTPTPVSEIGMVFLVRGKKAPICAIAPKGKGKQAADSILWQHAPNTPDVPCLVSNGKFVFSVNDNGLGYCFDAKTGEIYWNERLGGGPWYPSPILVDGKVYVVNMSGHAVVIAADKEFKVIAENDLPGRFIASPVVDGSDLILRSNTHLYRIGVGK